jgi:WW domain-containing oxidoreductase
VYSPTLGSRAKYGDELLIGVNFTGTVLFTELLLPRMTSRTRSSRVVNVASVAHLWAKIPKGESPLSLLRRTAPLDKSNYEPVHFNTYGLSKLLLIMYTKALSDELIVQGFRNTIVCAVHPGAVLTNIFRELGVVAKVMPVLLSGIFKNTEEGAETTLSCALGHKIASGGYYADCRIAEHAVSPLCRDRNACALVREYVRKKWKLTE